MKKVLVIVMITAFAGILTACAPAGAEAPAKSEKAIRVACIFNTTIKDEGYAQAAYGALMEMQTKYALDVSYQESVTEAGIKDVLRNYAADGFDLIIAHELYFTEAVNEIAPEFPDTKFAVSGGYSAEHANVVAVDATNWEATYLIGALAGLITETNKLGIITVTESPIAKRMVNAYKISARSQNPDIEVTHVFTGSFDDVVKGKELATAMIKNGVDVVYSNSGQGNLGAIEACKENGVYAIGSVVDLNDKAPDTVVSSSLLSPDQYIKIIIDGYMNGSLEWGKYYEMGVKDGIEGMAPYHSFENKIPQDVKDRVEQVKQHLIDGKIEIPPAE